MPKWLEGRTTYVIAAGVIAKGLIEFLQGTMDVSEFVNYVLGGLGLARLRAGVSKANHTSKEGGN